MFKIIKDKRTKHRLIIPDIRDRDCWKNYKNRWFRSLHLDENNHIVSLGLPKFMNLEEGSREFKITKEDLFENVGEDLISTKKLDGSLLIRYVHNNKVCWRTRGSLSVGLDNKGEIDKFVLDNPKLLDSSLYKNASLLFEWTSPDNQIVIRYKKPDITLIAGIRYNKGVTFAYSQPSLFSFNEIEEAASTLDANLVLSYFLDTKHNIRKLFSDLNIIDFEGWVIRFDNSQKMVKVKSKKYVTLHSLRSNLSIKKLFDIWWVWKCPKYEQFKEEFIETYDFECFEWAKNLIDTFYNGVKDAENIVREIELYATLRKQHEMSRKDFALLSSFEYKEVELSLCFVLFDNREIHKEMWRKIISKHTGRPTISMFD